MLMPFLYYSNDKKFDKLLMLLKMGSKVRR